MFALTQVSIQLVRHKTELNIFTIQSPFMLVMHMLLKYNRNSTGLGMEPCGTPQEINL